MGKGSKKKQLKTKMDTEEELFDPRFTSDKIFGQISRDYVRLDDESIWFSDSVGWEVIEDRLIPLMNRNQDFKNYFKKSMYGGSHYKGLKVDKPDTYQMNIVIELPIDSDCLEFKPDAEDEGFIKIGVKDHCFPSNNKFCQMLMDGRYIDQNKFRSWMHSVLHEALEKYRQRYGRRDFIVSYYQTMTDFTISVELRHSWEYIDINVVPCLMFYNNDLPKFRKSKYEWIAIAKPIPHYVQESNIQWRPSFYEDETEILSGQIKPIIRMMKRFRDAMGWSRLTSYMIETLFLHELNNIDFEMNYMQAPRTATFIYMLKRLYEVLDSECLLDYWYKNRNLLNTPTSTCWTKIANELRDVIDEIEDDLEYYPYVLLDYFSTSVYIESYYY